MAKPSITIQFRAGDLVEPLDDRASERVGISRDGAAKRDLARYYDVLARSLDALSLSSAESSLICDAARGTAWDTSSYRLLWAEIDDAIRLDQLDTKWNVDGPALVAKLRNLAPGTAMAIVDAVERFWLTPDDDREASHRRVGLVR